MQEVGDLFFQVDKKVDVKASGRLLTVAKFKSAGNNNGSGKKKSFSLYVLISEFVFIFQEEDYISLIKVRKKLYINLKNNYLTSVC